MKRFRKNVFDIKIILIAIIFVSVGFAFLTTTVNLNGMANVLPATWDIHFENIHNRKGVQLSAGDSAPAISGDGLSIDYSVTLPFPGDYYEFLVDVVNDGDIDAMVDTVVKSNLTTQQKKFVDISITYDNEDPLEHGYILLINQTKTLKVKVGYKSDISSSDVQEEVTTVPISIVLTYSQAEEGSYKVATFIEGYYVASKMTRLSNSYDENLNYVDNKSCKVKRFLKASELANNLTDDNIVSIEASDVPIYMWFEEDLEDEDNYGNGW